MRVLTEFCFILKRTEGTRRRKTDGRNPSTLFWRCNKTKKNKPTPANQHANTIPLVTLLIDEYDEMTRLLISIRVFLIVSFLTECAWAAHGGIRATASGGGDSNNNDREEVNKRIVGGYGTIPHDFYVQMERGCGATLIHSDIILSAAHCTYKDNNIVHVGAYISMIGFTRYIVDSIVHPMYNKETKEYDMMVMKLNAPVGTISPVKLTTNDNNLQIGDPMTIIGMGALQDGDEYGSAFLQEATVIYYSSQRCSKPYGDEWKDNGSMICAGSWRGADSCTGDSGGPLLKDGYQVGIVSFGRGCGNRYFPGIYTRISGSTDWIEESICKLSDYLPSYCPGYKEQQQTVANITKVEAVTNANAFPSNFAESGEGIPTTSPTQANHIVGGSDLSSTVEEHNLDPVFIPAPGTDIELRIDIVYDRYPIETSWILKNVDNDEIITNSDPYTIKEEGLITTLVENLSHGNYSFTVSDTAKDGICCQYGNGYIKIFQRSIYLDDDIILWDQPGDYGAGTNVIFELKFLNSTTSTNSTNTINQMNATFTNYTKTQMLNNTNSSTLTSINRNK